MGTSTETFNQGEKQMKIFIMRALIKELQTELSGLRDAGSTDLKQLVATTTANLDNLSDMLAKESTR